MLRIFFKECKLSASPLSFLFLLFGFMFFLPGYPVLCGAFFVTLGIFQSFQNVRETNDILFSALLPIAKRDVVKGKFLFVVFIELCALVLMGIATALRMTLLADVPAYRTNALMNANPFALGLAFLAFGWFNLLFVGGFFKTSYRFGRPFIRYIVCFFVTLSIGEALHYVPGLEFLNAFGFAYAPQQFLLLAVGILAFLLLTWVSYRISCVRFENTDL